MWDKSVYCDDCKKELGLGVKRLQLFISEQRVIATGKGLKEQESLECEEERTALECELQMRLRGHYVQIALEKAKTEGRQVMVSRCKIEGWQISRYIGLSCII